MNLVRRALTSALGVGAILVFASVLSAADGYPTKPIKLVVPVGAGSASDVRARQIGDRLSKALGQPIIIMTQSMNRPGKVTDNAYIESFFHSMKADIVHGRSFTEDRQIETALRDYVPFYNRTRLHSSLNYVPPATYERLT